MSPEQEQTILDLRAQNHTPRQIAAELNLRVSEVRSIIANHGEGPIFTLATKGDLPPIHECLVDQTCADYLLAGQQPDDWPQSCLGLVLVARLKGMERVSVCTYLVDYLCLGVKDTMKPHQLDRAQYPDFVQRFYGAFPAGYRAIALHEAQAIIFGAVEYAARLGFNPHPDFEQTLYHLGHWSGEPALRFGYQDKPLYINGPYDDNRQVIKMLELNAGRDQFNYILGVG